MEQINKGRTSDLIPDDKNFNKHTERGLSMLRKSIDRFGFGRSILVDKNNRIIGGNGVHEMAGDAETVVVETTGDKLVVVKRNDIDLDTKEGRELALADNATAAADLNWDTDQLTACAVPYLSSVKLNMINLRKDKKGPTWIIDRTDGEGFHRQINVTEEELSELQKAIQKWQEDTKI